MNMDATLFRSVMGRFATGVTVITFLVDEKAAGMTANAFMSVSLEPTLVLTSIRSQSRVNRFVQQGARFGVNVLAESQLDLCRHFSGRTIKDRDVPFIFEQGFPLLPGSLAHLGVRTVDVHPAGDHVLYVCEVEYVKLGEHRKPLVFFGGNFRQVHAHTPVINWTTPAECS